MIGIHIPRQRFLSPCPDTKKLMNTWRKLSSRSLLKNKQNKAVLPTAVLRTSVADGRRGACAFPALPLSAAFARNNRLHSVCPYGILFLCNMTGIPRRTISSRKHAMFLSRPLLSILGEEMFGDWLSTPIKRNTQVRSSSLFQSLITFTSFHLKSAER